MGYCYNLCMFWKYRHKYDRLYTGLKYIKERTLSLCVVINNVISA